MNTIIIDSNNLLHKIPALKKSFSANPENAQLSLIETITSKLKRTAKVIFVFDGFGNIKRNNIVYSGKFTADKIIREYIEQNYNKTTLIVVSSDNEITNLARICGCVVTKSEDFYSSVTDEKHSKNINEPDYKKDEKPAGMSKKDYNEFMKYFS